MSQIKPTNSKQDVVLALLLISLGVIPLLKKNIWQFSFNDIYFYGGVLLHFAAGMCVLLRHRVKFFLDSKDILLALPGIAAPLLIKMQPQGQIISLELSWLFIGIGFVWLFASIATLGRSFAILPVARPLVKSGPYRVVRHPVYLGYMIIWGGCLFYNFSFSMFFCFLLGFACMSVRILVEERNMASASYQNYCDCVCYRLIPFVW